MELVGTDFNSNGMDMDIEADPLLPLPPPAPSRVRALATGLISTTVVAGLLLLVAPGILFKIHQADQSSSQPASLFSTKLGKQPIVCSGPSDACDNEWNVKSQVLRESEWAYIFLKEKVTLRHERQVAAVIDKMVATLNATASCKVIEDQLHLTYGQYKSVVQRNKLITAGDSPGKRIALYFAASTVGWREFLTGMVDGEVVVGGKTTIDKSCKWDSTGASESLDTLVKRASSGDLSGGFMWTMKKGRNTAGDAGTKILFSATPSQLSTANDAFAQLGAVKPLDDPAVQTIQEKFRSSAAIPPVAWRMESKSLDAGLYFYNQAPALFKNYFPTWVAHGQGINIRSSDATDGPAKRMLEYGMPWIGGVSGSVVDFYSVISVIGPSAKPYGKSLPRLIFQSWYYPGFKMPLRWTEQVLADMVTLLMAHLGIAGHHSLGEALYGAAQTELAYTATLATPRPASEEGALVQTTSCKGKNYYFYSHHMAPLIEATRVPLGAFNYGAQTAERQALYDAAIADFIGRTRVTLPRGV